MSLINKLIEPFAQSIKKAGTAPVSFAAENIPSPNLFFIHRAATGNAVTRRMCYRNFNPYTCNRSRALRYSK